MKADIVEIDRDLCSGCGLCIGVCPAGTISLCDGRAVVTGSDLQSQR